MTHRVRARALASAAVGLSVLACSADPPRLVVGSKNFTEQDLIGEIVSVWIEQTTRIPVRRRLHLGGTFLCHRAILGGEIDLYVEYTGTSLTAILGKPAESDPETVRRTVERAYRERFDLVWTEALGFENTFAMLVRESTADSLSLHTLSEAAPHSGRWTPGFGYEFVEREDGLAGLQDAYGMRFAAAPRVMDLGLTYRALASGEVDFIAGNSTDGRIEALHLRQLVDDRRYFPPYEAAPIVRRGALERFPELRRSLSRLGGRLGTEDMRALNRAVDLDGRPYQEVAAEWVSRVLAAERRDGPGIR